ncbi:14154_t:CDS:1 [Funneliformis geosporum]|nr:14154_t:CDS:1 [Funneliformis geosporum]
MPDKEKSNARLWGEEIKCLFLRYRELSDEAIEDFVKEIFNYDLFSDNAEEVISHSKRTLADFRSKFNKKIEGKVQELKNKRLKEGLKIATITRLEVNKFISQEVVEQILDRYLKGTNRKMLKNCRMIERLVLFVREAFKVYYTAYNVKAIKKLDKIMMDFKILSRSSKNIALKLSL